MNIKRGTIRNWILFFTALLALLAIGYYFAVIQSPEPAVPEGGVSAPITSEESAQEAITPKPVVPNLTDQQKFARDNAAYEGALFLASIEGCENITYNETLKTKCLSEVHLSLALRGNNLDECDSILDAAVKKTCYDKVYFALALLRQNLDSCNKVGDSALRQDCLDHVIASAGGKTSASECGSVKLGSLKQDCMDRFYLASALKTRTETGCSSIQDATLKSQCIQGVSESKSALQALQKSPAPRPKTTEERLTDCGALEATQKTACKDSLYYSMALDKKDLSYCDSIEDRIKKTECKNEQKSRLNHYYLRQATALNDAALCDKIPDAAVRATCLKYIQKPQ